MLVGNIRFNYGDIYSYRVEGIDTATTMSLTLIADNNKSAMMMANATASYIDNEEDNILWERRMDIRMNSVAVQRVFIRDKDNKIVQSYNYNIDFFTSLAALIRYAKMQCCSRNATDYTGLRDASNEFIPNTVVTYNISDANNNNLGTAELTLSDITRLRVSNTWFEIDLHEDGIISNNIMPKIENAVPKIFMFNEEFLGFTPYSEAKAVETANGLYRDLAEVIAAHPEKELEWLRDKQYYIVSDDEFDSLIEKFSSIPDDDFLFVDTETTGLNINFKSRVGQADQCVGFIISYEDGVSYYFPTQMKFIKNLCNGDHNYVMSKVKKLLETKKLVGHNAPFDWKVFYIYDINANFTEDTIAMVALTYGNEKLNYPLGLKDNAKILLHRDSLELSDLVEGNSWGESDVAFWDLPYELVKFYACADTDNTRGIFRYFKDNDILHKYNADRIYRIEVVFGLAVAYSEFYGHWIDVNDIEKLREDIKNEIDENMAKMVEIVGHDFNPNSSPQLVKIMYDELGIPKQISRKTGRVTTDKDTLHYLDALTNHSDEPMYPFVHYLLKYRVAEGIRKIVDKFDTVATEDGFVFSEVMQYGTTTGRVSIKSPNYQSYNDAVKKYVRPRQGYYMADTDYSSIEYRVTGNMSGNKMIKEGFYDPDFDYHTYQAARMYGVPYASVTKELRKAAKGFNFGIPYGMGNESLGVRIFGEASKENTAKAAILHKKYFAGGQEDVEAWFENTRDNAIVNGYTETYFGRRRYYHRSKFSVPAIRRQAGNAVIQGCLDGDTRIQTSERGIVKIKDAVGQTLNVWDGEGWTNGDILYSGKKRKCIVTFSNGQQFICSPEHKFLVVSHRGNKRFVECKDLRGSDSYKNPHRVATNQVYEPSQWEYSSDWAQKFDTSVNNVNNIHIDDINNSFDEGVFLGRLASDGCYAVKDLKDSYIQQSVTEREESILAELRTCMDNLGFVETHDAGEECNEKMTHLTVYSKSLAQEIVALDIKHKVHDNIFMDTELLRGFLSGFFDGERGIIGKCIALVFGMQYDFESMCCDLQKALLFFGVRSKYEKRDDRYILFIETEDSDRFCELIGFLNQDKQDKCKSLKSKKGERTFGKCLVVKSVEITDEYIDMYDVCNTDKGYYVADGIITHNTAADIYKLAVGRVFLRICKEGWLGKVLLDGFIHDELLIEIHNTIDPMIFLNALRDEFEVKIEGWCPLYMGFGFGMSWYQAKKTELPIQLQWELVEKYGKTGYPNWHGSGIELCDDIDFILRDFEIRHVAKYLTDADSQGNEIKPAINSSLVSILKSDAADYEAAIYDYLTDKGILYKDDSGKKIALKSLDSTLGINIQEILKADKPLLREKMKKHFLSESCIPDDKDSIDIALDLFEAKVVFSEGKKKGSVETQDAINIFCFAHGFDRSSINVLSIDTSVAETSNNNLTVTPEHNEVIEEVFDTTEEINRRIRLLGLYLDTTNKQITLRLVPNNYMEFIKNHSSESATGYKLFFKDVDNDKLYETSSYIASSEVSVIQQMYISYFSAANVQ